MIVIPIGIDCDLAIVLRKYNIRRVAFPFDWNVTYYGVSNIIKNNFDGFIPESVWKVNKCGVLFIHEKLPDDIPKYERRINRLNQILDSNNIENLERSVVESRPSCDEQIVFVRKGHAHHHHEERSDTENDIIDAYRLDVVLKEKYPNLKYTIIVILVCGDCFDSNKEYISTSPNVKIYNIAMPHYDANKFEEFFVNVLLKNKIVY